MRRPGRWRRWRRSASASGAVDGRRRVVLEVRQRRVLGVGGEPAVDEDLDDAGPAQRAADEVAAALGLEVADRLGVLVARAGQLDLRLDRRPRGSSIPSASAIFDSTSSTFVRCSARGRNSAWRSASVLLGGLEVRLLADALAGELRAELVVHHLDLLVDQDVGQLDGRVGDGVLDDLVGELVARPVERVAAEPLVDVGLERGEVRVVAHVLGERVVGVGEDLLAQLLEVHGEVRLLAGEGRPPGSPRGR